MPTRIFYVPVLLCIEADNRHIAIDEAKAIAAVVAAERRHLRKDVLIPALTDEAPPPGGFTLPPTERVLHRGIPD